MKLFLFHYAGGSAASFGKWLPLLNHEIALRAIDLPGHGKRIRESLLSHIEQMIDFLVGEIEEEMTPLDDYVLFGHSMGGLLAHCVAGELASRGYSGIRHIVISGCDSPENQMLSWKSASLLSETEFIQKITAMGGLPKQVLASKELMNIYIPILQADLTALNTYNCEKYTTIHNCPLTLLKGRDDPLQSAKCSNWSEYTSREYYEMVYSGGHFFPDYHNKSICVYINQICLSNMQ
jgi:surfactin synthase thioesterase subunit